MQRDDKIVSGAPVYNVLHGNEHDGAEDSHEIVDAEDDLDTANPSHKLVKHESKQETLESLDFTDMESMMWRKVMRTCV
jgi:hypothetical protein